MGIQLHTLRGRGLSLLMPVSLTAENHTRLRMPFRRPRSQILCQYSTPVRLCVATRPSETQVVTISRQPHGGRVGANSAAKPARKAEIKINVLHATCPVFPATALHLAEIASFFNRMDSYVGCGWRGIAPTSSLTPSTFLVGIATLDVGPGARPWQL